MAKQVLIFLLTTMLLNQGEKNGFIEKTSKHWLLNDRKNTLLSTRVFQPD